jgi:hypothetical protein
MKPEAPRPDPIEVPFFFAFFAAGLAVFGAIVYFGLCA